MRVNKTDVEDLKKLPEWVKCMACGGKPLQNDWLLEVVPNSNALLHQSCAAKKGKLPGLNIGMEKGD
jgi:hypothetical protein